MKSNYKLEAEIHQLRALVIALVQALYATPGIARNHTVDELYQENCEEHLRTAEDTGRAANVTT